MLPIIVFLANNFSGKSTWLSNQINQNPTTINNSLVISTSSLGLKRSKTFDQFIQYLNPAHSPLTGDLLRQIQIEQPDFVSGLGFYELYYLALENLYSGRLTPEELAVFASSYAFENLIIEKPIDRLPHYDFVFVDDANELPPSFIYYLNMLQKNGAMIYITLSKESVFSTSILNYLHEFELIDIKKHERKLITNENDISFENFDYIVADNNYTLHPFEISHSLRFKTLGKGINNTYESHIIHTASLFNARRNFVNARLFLASIGAETTKKAIHNFIKAASYEDQLNSFYVAFQDLIHHRATSDIGANQSTLNALYTTQINENRKLRPLLITTDEVDGISAENALYIPKTEFIPYKLRNRFDTLTIAKPGYLL